jgi:hypothetical protein
MVLHKKIYHSYTYLSRLCCEKYHIYKIFVNIRQEAFIV